MYIIYLGFHKNYQKCNLLMNLPEANILNIFRVKKNFQNLYFLVLVTLEYLNLLNTNQAAEEKEKGKVVFLIFRKFRTTVTFTILFLIQQISKLQQCFFSFSIKAVVTLAEVLFTDHCNPWQSEVVQPHQKGCQHSLACQMEYFIFLI